MGNPDKETVADAPAPAPAAEPVQAHTETTEPTATETGTIALPTETSPAEPTRALEDLSIIPATAPPTYEDTQKEAITAPAAAVTSHEDPIEAARAHPTYPSYDEKLAINAQVPVDPRLTPLAKLYDKPKLISCPFCYQNAMTRVQKESTSATSMASVCCCLLGGLICAFLPFCMEMCHDIHHFCTNCGQKVVTVPHDEPVQVFSPSNPGTVVTPPRLVQAPEAVLKN